MRRTVQQIVDAVLPVPFLDDPAPQMVEQLPDILQFFRALSPDPEQVIEVPKILPEDVSMRTAVRDTAAGRTAGGMCPRSYLCLLCVRLWSRTRTFQFLVVVTGCLGDEVFKVSPRDRIQQRFLEQITLTFQFRVVEVFKVFVMDRFQQVHHLTHVTLRMRL